MAILEEDVARVRLSTDIVEVVQEHVALRKVGRRWSGLCPFHAEKSPSFSVNGEGFYYCFGCQAKGDVITFVREIEHIDFVEAVERLASRAGIEIHYDNVKASADRKKRSALVEAMERAVDWYHERLLTSPDANAARAYLRDRGYDGDVVRQFKMGWAPAGWDELSRALKLPESVLKDSGLGFVNRRGRAQDAFRERILFPIFDPSGAPVAFGGRILPGAEGPKYKNSSETPLYAKSRTLYALNWAKPDVIEKNEVVVCEGYTDVIGFFLAGVPRAVATCGTALTEEHVRLLKNFAPRVVLAYDADSAGEAAAERFYEWERKLGIDIVVAVLPKGMDPADAARRDPAMLKEAVQQAQPFLKFRLGRLLRSGDKRSIEGRARLAQQAVALVAEHPDPGVRHQYLQEIEGWSRIPADELRRMLQAGPGAAPPVRSSKSVDARRGHIGEDAPLRAEWEALRVAVHQPEDVAILLDQIVPASPSAGAVGVEEVLFVDHRARAAFRALVESPTLHDAIANAEPEASEVLSRLTVEEGESTAADEFLRLVDRAANRAIRDLEVDARVSPDGLSRLGPTIAWLKLTVEQLRAAETSLDAAAALVGWLLEQPDREP